MSKLFVFIFSRDIMVPITLTAEPPSPSSRSPYPQMADMTEAIPRAFSLLQMAETKTIGLAAGDYEVPGDEVKHQPQSLLSLSPMSNKERWRVEGRRDVVQDEGNEGDDEEEEEGEGEEEIADDDDVEEDEEIEDSSESSSDKCDDSSDDDKEED